MQKTQLEKISNQKAAIIESYLKEFGQDKDKGTGFYSDITVLRGPSTSEYKYFENKKVEFAP